MWEATTKTVDDIVKGVQRQFGDEAEVQVKIADVIRWVNNGQRDIVINNPEINATKATAPFVAGQRSYPLLSDAAFADLLTVRSIHYDGMRLRALTFQEAEDILATAENEIGGAPVAWYTYEGAINFYPTPDLSVPGNFTIFFTKAPPRVTSRTDSLGIPDNYYNALEQFVLAQAFEMDENGQMAQMKVQQYEKSLGIQKDRTVEQSNTFPRVRLDPGDY